MALNSKVSGFFCKVWKDSGDNRGVTGKEWPRGPRAARTSVWSCMETFRGKYKGLDLGVAGRG